METVAAVVIMSIVGLIALTAVYRLLTGKGSDTFSGGCGCPACSAFEDAAGSGKAACCTHGHEHAEHAHQAGADAEAEAPRPDDARPSQEESGRA